MFEYVESYLNTLYLKIGIDIPANSEEIVQFCVNDISECSDPENWNSGDIDIAFRRYLETKNNN